MNARGAFPDGLALAPHKQRALNRNILVAPAPRVALLALDQGSGREAVAVVQPGDQVYVGTILARDAEADATSVHSPIAGRVRAIERRETAGEAGWGTCIEIDNDGTARVDPGIHPPTESTLADPVALIAGLREAGIGGLGGAAFPAATKLQAARVQRVSRLVLNGAECEPWICCDDALMREQSDEIVAGAQVLARTLAAETCSIVIEDDKPQAIAAMRAAIARTSTAALHVVVVPAIYPRGAERQLITAVTGLEVPTRELPAAVGVHCQNVATAAAIGRWCRSGEPSISRIVTVTGGAVKSPGNVLACIGTPLHELIACAGGYEGEPYRLIAGGNMTGRALATDAPGLIKGINCIVAATLDDVRARAAAREVPCIRCGDCAATCPAGLLPQQLHRAALARDTAALEQLGLVDCIECGCCDYVCPSQIPLTHRFKLARREAREREDERRRAVAARERFERHERRLREAAAAEQDAFDLARQQARETAATQPVTGIDPGAQGR